MKTRLLALLSVVVVCVCNLRAQVVPAIPCKVTVKANDRRIWVQDPISDTAWGPEYSLVIKGVNWEPSSDSPATDPFGDPGVFQGEYSKWYGHDIRLMAQMGVNVIRVYHDFGTIAQAKPILDKCYEHGIKVIMTVDSPRHGVVNDQANIVAVVNAYKNHPAILMWAVGNEWDNPVNTTFYGSYPTLYSAASAINANAGLIKGDATHPVLDGNHLVTTFCRDPHIPNDSSPAGVHYLDVDTAPWAAPDGPFFSEVVNTYATAVDVWGLNIYRGASFQDVFAQWNRITAASYKPMFIGEFGADAYNHGKPGGAGVDEAMQKNFDLGLLDETQPDFATDSANRISSGVLLFEWNDEWWKNGAPGAQSPSAEVNGAQPDGFNDEEYFGVAGTLNGARVLRAVYTALQMRYQTGGEKLVPLSANPALNAVSKRTGAIFQINGKTVYDRMGGNGGARGFNLAVLDASTGIRMSDYQHFDTYADHAKHADLRKYLDDLPVGTIVLIAIADEGGLVNYNNTAIPEAAATISMLQTVWHSAQIGDVKYQQTWAMIARKGDASPLSESYGGANDTSANGSVFLPGVPQYTVTASAGLGGSITPLGAIPVTSGGNATFSAIRDPGYRVADWFTNGVIVPTAAGQSSYTLTGVTADTAVQVAFKVAKPRDFNGDGSADVILQNNFGQIAVWYSSGSGAIIGSGWIFPGGLGDWRVMAIADTNKDGNPDLVLQNTFGQIAAWYCDGTGTVTSSGWIFPGGLGDWRVAGLADMNNDGNVDVVLQNTFGQIAAWYRNGAGAVTSSGWVFSGGLGDWRVAALTDVNGDGNVDIILQNTFGQIAAWYSNGSGAIAASGWIFSGGLGDWRVVATADMNNDANADILLQNTFGQIAVWYLSNSGIVMGSGWIFSGGLGDWRVR